MKESIHKYFQISTIQWMSYPHTEVLSAVRKIAEDEYFDAVEVTHIEDPRVRKEVKGLLAQSHLTVGYGAQPRLLATGLNPNAVDETHRAAAEDLLKCCVDEAQELGAKRVAIMAGRWREETKDLAYIQLLKTVRAVCGYAGEKDMEIELEVFDYDMDKCALIGPAPYAARFAADVRTTNSNFGLMVDLSHIPTTHESTRFVIQTLRPFITHLHCGNAVVRPNCAAYGDKHPRFGYPNGANDVAEVTEYFRVLREEGFFRAAEPMMFSVEVTPQGSECEDIILANSKRVMNRAWALLED